MKRNSKALRPDKRLGVLVMQFRSTRDQTVRSGIAASYALAVAQLIKSKRWREIPPLEDQLPDDWMPMAFFDYWSLRPTPQRTRRKG